jgi:hypothetical protein
MNTDRACISGLVVGSLLSAICFSLPHQPTAGKQLRQLFYTVPFACGIATWYSLPPGCSRISANKYPTTRSVVPPLTPHPSPLTPHPSTPYPLLLHLRLSFPTTLPVDAIRHDLCNGQSCRDVKLWFDLLDLISGCRYNGGCPALSLEVSFATSIFG